MAVEPFPGGGNGGQGGTLGEPSENDLTPDSFKFNEKYISFVLVGLVGYVLLKVIK